MLRVRRRPGANRSAGLLFAAGKVYPCRLGRSGIAAVKREGDGTTPTGSYRLLYGFFRGDRLRKPQTALTLRAIRPEDGWCDEPAHPAYNRQVRLPFAASHERMWRDDALYDICIVLDHNFTRRARNRGSAVFFHLTAEKPYTAGCIAIDRAIMEKLLPLLSERTRMVIEL
ncbi:MAG: L,D-transpeptidase family protein [Nitratireductor sp.]|nr:L,D-transpeptidase family protein [Nitratireductor sp.]